MPAAFDDLWIGQVVSLGATAINPQEMSQFCKTFAPHWDCENGAPDVLVYAIWSRLHEEAAQTWPTSKLLAMDALRWSRNPPPGELLRARMTIMGKDAVGDTKGVIIAQHDLLDEAGRLVFSCLTRSIFQRNPKIDFEI